MLRPCVRNGVFFMIFHTLLAECACTDLTAYDSYFGLKLMKMCFSNRGKVVSHMNLVPWDLNDQYAKDLQNVELQLFTRFAHLIS